MRRRGVDGMREQGSRNDRNKMAGQIRGRERKKREVGRAERWSTGREE